ncbi:MAG: meromycolic acid enoyl-[acyl-carrier-protein] reductase [Frankiales bacterium]|jgi:enoyl-[acyl-carrier protein] reductase I|nr:short-chain dehydrogenase/reductase [Frankiales bacterium]MCW2708481.1 short-chain dehydrogenase/reductase [Frankiales bacterium]MDX6218433.1 meromycolic acid enoyl-[acyl-carrier-protein] reductase [Frankiales bacterium]MDX6266002.1 meromycolic acid enoyl-[acyl-carrier-protein] reductase [Frankiales bacterium]
MLLEGKRLLITGVLTDQSIAFSVARLAAEQGAQVVLTGFGRSLSLTNRIARRLPGEPPVVQLDVTSEEDLELLPKRVREHVDGLDGVLHAIGFAPADCLGQGLLDTPWESVSTAVQVSTWSYAALARASLSLMPRGSSYVGLDFDARVAWPAYDWMGVAKAGLESANRYLARDLGAHGVRSNLVSAGPLKTMAAKSIPGFAQFEDAWGTKAPLGWDVTDAEPVAQAVVALMSDWFPATTGQIVYVDGGFSAIGV